MRVTQHHQNQADRRPGVVPFSVTATTGRHPTVGVTGELDVASAPEVGAVLLTAGVGCPMVHLDLGETTFIDSAGIRVLVRSMWDLQATGSGLVLVAASPEAENLLRITGILDVLKDQAP